MGDMEVRVEIKQCDYGVRVILDGKEIGTSIPSQMTDDQRRRLDMLVRAIYARGHLDGRLAVRDRIAAFLTNGSISGGQ